MNERQNELYHYGVKHRSGRYAYGSGARPYQDLEGRFGLFKRSGKKKPKNRVQTAKKKPNTKAKNPQEAEEAKPEPNSRTKRIMSANAKSKEEALKSMSPTDLMAVKNQLSDEELERALKRVRNENNLEVLSLNELSRNTSSHRSAVDAYKHRKDISDDDLTKLNQRLKEEETLRGYKNAEIERGKKFVRTLDKLNKSINKGLDYYDTYKRVSRIFEENDKRVANKEETKRAEKRAKKQAKKEAKAEAKVEKQREKENRTAFDAAAAYNEYLRDYTPKSSTISLVGDIVADVGSKPVDSLPRRK